MIFQMLDPSVEITRSNVWSGHGRAPSRLAFTKLLPRAMQLQDQCPADGVKAAFRRQGSGRLYRRTAHRALSILVRDEGGPSDSVRRFGITVSCALLMQLAGARRRFS